MVVLHMCLLNFNIDKLYEPYFNFMQKWLNKAYPYRRNSGNAHWFYLGIGVFVALFLMVFQAFQINIWETEYKMFKLAGFGFIAFIVPYGLSFLPGWIFNERKLEYHYKVKHEVTWSAIILGAVALANLLYATEVIGIFRLNLYNYFVFLGMVFAIGIFPILAGIWRNHSKYSKLNIAEAYLINQFIKPNQEKAVETSLQIQFTAENEKDHFQLEASKLLYIESMDNYCRFVYQAEEQIKKQILRGSLKRFESQNVFYPLIRCHRSFIVNLLNVEKMSGNAQGYTLHLKTKQLEVPVSRKYGPDVKAFYKILS
jgi:hypothetical protein